MARFDREIPPGGEGKVTLQMNLAGYRGKVTKSATVFSNDPSQGRARITLTGQVQPLIEVQPTSLLFRGLPEEMRSSTVALTGVSEPFKVLKVRSTVDDDISYDLETLEEGKRYAVKVSNKRLEAGQYRGLLKIETDHPRKPQVVVRVRGYVEGGISVRPRVITVGKLFPERPVRTGQFTVTSRQGEPLEIVRLTYDESLLEVNRKSLKDSDGKELLLEVVPRMERVGPGEHRKTSLSMETSTGQVREVQIHVIHRKP